MEQPESYLAWKKNYVSKSAISLIRVYILRYKLYRVII